MPRRLIKAYMPDPHQLLKQRSLGFFGARLHDPALWHLSRRSVALGLSLGVFAAFVPIPFQMVLAALLALWLRGNLPLAVLTVWITNPITMPPIFYATYRLGTWLLDSRPLNLQFQLSWDWLSYNLGVIWQPLLLGSLTLGTLLGLLTYATVSLVWRWSVVTARRKRLRLRRRRRKPKSGGKSAAAKRPAGTRSGEA